MSNIFSKIAEAVVAVAAIVVGSTIPGGQWLVGLGLSNESASVECRLLPASVTALTEHAA